MANIRNNFWSSLKKIESELNEVEISREEIEEQLRMEDSLQNNLHLPKPNQSVSRSTSFPVYKLQSNKSNSTIFHKKNANRRVTFSALPYSNPRIENFTQNSSQQSGSMYEF